MTDDSKRRCENGKTSAAAVRDLYGFSLGPNRDCSASRNHRVALGFNGENVRRLL